METISAKNLTVQEKLKLSSWVHPIKSVYTNIYKRMERSGFPESYAEGIAWMRNLSAPFILVDDAAFLKAIAALNCDLIVVGEEMAKHPYGFFFPKDSPLKDDFDYAYVELILLLFLLK